MAFPGTISGSGAAGAARPRGAFVAAGALLLVFGLSIVGWIVYDFRFTSLGGGDFLRALVDARVRVTPALFSPQVWALTAAVLTAGVLALARRPAARGAALFVGWVVLAVAARELAGLFTSGDYRDRYLSGNGLEAVIIVTWALAFAVAGTVLVLMLAARTQEAPRPGAASAGAGVVLLLLGLLSLAWIGWGLTGSDYRLDAGDYVLHLVNAAHPADAGIQLAIGGTFWFYEAVYTTAMFVLGGLALAGRPAARSAGVALAAVLLYLDVRHMLGLTLGSSSGPSPEGGDWYPSWEMAGADTEGKLQLASIVLQTLACALVIVLLVAAGARAHRAGLPGAAGFAGGWAPQSQPQSPPPGYSAQPGYPAQPGYVPPPPPHAPHTPSPGPYQPPPQGGFGPPPSL
ncbi:hypothetical protein ACFQLX_20020 [Streptomyces polyrhachis]|uniref:Uncharacterized protein n=1 Tax=Streptomyces polyrhachis TaxID=1282885 RepID=A0ABW2GMR7_9ACTN